jgi:hypothetical protein
MTLTTVNCRLVLEVRNGTRRALRDWLVPIGPLCQSDFNFCLIEKLLNVKRLAEEVVNFYFIDSNCCAGGRPAQSEIIGEGVLIVEAVL